LALALAGVALVGVLLAAVYTFRFNPEIAFYRQAVEVKQQWAERVGSEGTPLFVFCGGSSCAFSVDGQRMLDRHGVAAVNYGLHAGMGPRCLTGLAADVVRPGDTLVVAIEPELLALPFGASDLGAQIGLVLGKPQAIRASQITGAPVDWSGDILALRPGAYHAFTLLGKIALGRPLYRYSADDLTPSGLQCTAERREFADMRLFDRLSADGRALLVALKGWGDDRGIEVVYSLPWGYVDPQRAAAARQSQARFLLDVASAVPVLKDPALGVYTVREHYADTDLHLTVEGAAIRSDSLAEQIRAGAHWTCEELGVLAGQP
jgi:hypothetical protein